MLLDPTGQESKIKGLGMDARHESLGSALSYREGPLDVEAVDRIRGQHREAVPCAALAGDSLRVQRVTANVKRLREELDAEFEQDR